MSDDTNLPKKSEPTPQSEQSNAGSDLTYGDKVGGDKITAGSFTDSIAAIGAGAQVNVTINQAGPSAKKKPKLSYEPETVLIPAGKFIMGSDEHETVESPQHEVKLPAYRIGVYPVTNEEFAHFIWQTGRAAAKELLWDGNQPQYDQLHHPVLGLTWFDALEYCQWLSQETGRIYSLPNEAQWEKAARGTDGRLYPWGNEWQPERCNSDPDLITAVNTFPPQSPFGCYDMVGNGREWTTTLWGTISRQPDARYHYPWREDGRNALNAPSTTWRVFRGGRARTPETFRCTARHGYPPTDWGPKRNRHGFRVVYLTGE